ncbi:MAG TPA: adenylate/guanylate cyclase domain-containing protein [Anaerolineales bacterium]|nr:adenylate/guanylate cyclase domain-containing protein [Anaerolineales bacterium]
MDHKSTPSTTLPLDRQILRLSEFTDQVRLALQAEYNPCSEDALEDLAQLAGSLTRISRQIARQEEERDNLLALAGISQIVNSSLQLDDVLRIVMDTIVRLTGAERGFLMLKDGQGELAIHIARNWEQETLDASESDLSRSVVNRVIDEGQPVLTTNAQQDPRFDSQESVIALNLRSILCVPLKVKDDLIGVIYADNRIRTGLFTEAERNLLAAFANQAAVAIENARLFESIHRSLADVSELKNLMDDVFASIASGVITTDLADRITLSNGAAEAILGQSRSDLIGRNVGEVPLLSNLQLPRYLARVRQSNQQIVGLEFSPELPGRGSLTLSFNLSPLKDAHITTQGVAIVMEDLTETRRLEAQRRLFERMVSPAVIDQLNPSELQLGGKRTQITTLFADMRGFTSLSERCAPEELVSVLNRYLGAATEAILGEGGTIDKFLGDAIMAFFNAPIPQRDHTLRAMRAALSMRAAVSAVQKELPPQFQLSFGTGIHSGEAVLGLIGTQKRMEYTVIGDSVNTAKRLQENANPGQILISVQVYEQVRNQVLTQQVTPVVAKGKSEPIRVYELIGLR